MSNTLIFVEHDASAVKKAALAGITCGQLIAKQTGGKLFLLMVGPGATEAAETAKAFGAEKIFLATGAETEHLTAEVMTQILVAAQKATQATRIVASASSLTKDCFPRFAARADGAIATDIVAVVSKDQYRRPMWAGNVLAEVALHADMHVLTARTTDFGAPEQSGAATVENLTISFDARIAKTKFISRKEIKSERPDVTTADRVVSGGRGVKSAEGFKQVEKLADLLGAGVGASRAVCDAGWVSNDLQIGQTGKVVAPNLYVAVGISGAIQHLAGMKGSKTIVAINQDAEAPIFQVADYGLVQDLFKAVPELMTAVTT